MKRKILIVLTILLIFSACSKKDNKENTKVDNSKVESIQKSEETKKVKILKRMSIRKYMMSLREKNFSMPIKANQKQYIFIKMDILMEHLEVEIITKVKFLFIMGNLI